MGGWGVCVGVRGGKDEVGVEVLVEGCGDGG